MSLVPDTEIKQVGLCLHLDFVFKWKAEGLVY